MNEKRDDPMNCKKKEKKSERSKKNKRSKKNERKIQYNI